MSQIHFGPWKLQPCQVFYESQHSYGIVNLKPLLPGHVLVISKRVVPRYGQLSLEEAQDLFACVHEIGPIIEQHFGATAINIAIQDGKDAGQSVPHVHVHILPRHPGDYQNNDDVYDDLDKHNAAFDPERVREPRTLQEMEVESNVLRRLFPHRVPSFAHHPMY